MSHDAATTVPRILLVQSDGDICLVLQERLACDRYRIDTAQTGTEAMHFVRRVPYDAVLLDVWLSDVDGLTLLRAIKEVDPLLPVLVLTGFIAEEMLRDVFEAGALAYLTMPYTASDIEAVVEEAVGIRRVVQAFEGRRRPMDVPLPRHVAGGHGALVMTDHRFRILFWSVAAERVFAYNEQEIAGKELPLLFPKLSRQGTFLELETIKARRAGAGFEKVIDLEGLRKDGATFPLTLSLCRWRTKAGVVYSVVMRPTDEKPTSGQGNGCSPLSVKVAESSASMGV